MSQKDDKIFLDQRKKDHIDMALSSQVDGVHADSRFYYEPLLAHHASLEIPTPFKIAGRQLLFPIWISSMTGGTAYAGQINRRLAGVCKEFGLGMGLGSCRIILQDDTYLEDFNMRPYIGNEAPLFANLGIAQIEQIIKENKWNSIYRLIEKLNADGLIIHVNPLQEWLQPEGDPITFNPIDCISLVVEKIKLPIIVKEVGQGMGPRSLKALLKLPLEAIEFAAIGGTNFSDLEIKRRAKDASMYKGISHVGHTALEMVHFTNEIYKKNTSSIKCKKLIISGGIKDFLDGYYLMKKSTLPSIYGQASAFLKHAQQSEKALHEFVKDQIKGLELAYNYLTVK